MAFDVLRGKQDDKDWSLGGDWAFDAVVDRAKKSVPLKAVAVGTTVGLLWMLWPSKKQREMIAGSRSARWDERTQEIPRQTMHETVYGRKAS